MKLWRKETNGTYTLVASKTRHKVGEYWDVEVAKTCAAPASQVIRQCHTNAILTVFYGSWAGPYSVNSSAISLWC